MNKKLIGLVSVIAIATLLTTGCGKKVVSVNGTAVSLDGVKIKSNDYYDMIKEESISKLVDEIDHKLFDKKYETTDEETKEIDSQVEQLKSSLEQYYGKSDDETFNSLIKQYYGVENEKELRNQLSLDYKRKQAVNDYIKDNLTDKEIENYYNEKIYGDMAASHILISVDVADDAKDEEIKKAEEKALKKAKEVIKKLDEGKKFASLAKKYSDDDATKNKGGDLGTFKYTDMEEDFSKACKDLEVNKYTKEPVKTKYGYHIILKTKQEDKAKLDDVKDEIKETLKDNKLNADSSLYYKTLVDIRKDKKIKWTDTVLEKAYEEYANKLIENSTQSTTTTQQ